MGPGIEQPDHLIKLKLKCLKQTDLNHDESRIVYVYLHLTN